MSVLPDYMSDVVQEMCLASRRQFVVTSRHTVRLLALIAKTLSKSSLQLICRKRFGISTGFVISHDGMFSKQADLVVVDEQNNSPLYPNTTNKIWPVESVYALIEVKTKLDPRELRDAIDKGRTFKRLPRKFCDTWSRQPIRDSLFVIWAFESDSVKTTKAHLVNYSARCPECRTPRLCYRSGSPSR